MSQRSIEVRDMHIVYKSLKPIRLKNAIFSLHKNRTEYVEALRGVSFAVDQGEIIGVIGKNGSGKSTLLRAISGIFSPDSGTIDTFGNTVSLMSLGVGFQPQLSGRENIYLSALLLGFRENQIKTKLDEIIDFSELGEFIDMPVRTYSSGMFTKLAFSISAVMEPDILLIDEVLSVGDAKFKKKSFSRIKQLIGDDGRTAIIVSHNMNTIRTLCSKVLWLSNGVMRMFGQADKVIAEYEDESN